MLMDQVMAAKYELATIREMPADLVKKGQAREMKDLDDMNVLEWVKEKNQRYQRSHVACVLNHKEMNEQMPRLSIADGNENEISIRCASTRRGAETRFVQENTARESEVLVRTRLRHSKRSRRVASTHRNEPGRHRDEALAKSQIGIPQEFDGKELRERDDVPSRPWRAT